MQHIGERGDGQILSLELMAIAVGLATFAEELKGRQVWIFEDNTGAEAITQKGSCTLCALRVLSLGYACVAGSSKAADHNALVHEIWTLALSCGISIWVDRVPSDDNLADLPSREEYRLLEQLGAAWKAPLLPDLAGYV
jgi:hypothetical protein